MIFESQPFPTTSYTYAHDLAPDLVERIEEAFFSFDFAGTALGEEFEGVEKFIPITYQDQWEVIRTIQASNGVSYTADKYDGLMQSRFQQGETVGIRIGRDLRVLVIALGAVFNLPYLALSLIAVVMNVETVRRVITASRRQVDE